MKAIKAFAPFLFQIAIFAMALFLPFFSLQFDANTILTSVALLFTILIGFFIAAATSNYLRLQSLISSEDAQLITIFEIVTAVQPSAQKEIAELIDKYMIAILDFDLLGYTSSTMKEFNALSTAISKVQPSSDLGMALMQNLYNARSSLTSIRQESLVSFKKTVSMYHWFILISLAIVIAFILIGLREDLVSSCIIGLSLIALYQALNLLYKIDSCTFLAIRLGYENPQEVFLAIGRPKYYPEHAISRKKIKKVLENETIYRVGFYEDFPKTYNKKIRTFNKIKEM